MDTSDDLDSRLADLAGRIRQARQRLEEAGGPAKHSATELQQRQELLRNKLDTAAHDHAAWDMFRYEIELDITSLERDFERWIRYTDGRYRKSGDD